MSKHFKKLRYNDNILFCLTSLPELLLNVFYPHLIFTNTTVLRKPSALLLCFLNLFVQNMIKASLRQNEPQHGNDNVSLKITK